MGIGRLSQRRSPLNRCAIELGTQLYGHLRVYLFPMGATITSQSTPKSTLTQFVK